MPRSRWIDHLQSHLFWAMDVTGGSGVAPVFTPIFGFSGITAPQISVEVDTFKDGTYIYPRHVVKGATTGAVTFRRAASIYDSDFYDWIYSAIYGMDKKDNLSLGDLVNSLYHATNKVKIRRDLLVLQFSRVNVSGSLASLMGGSTAADKAFGAMAASVAGAFTAAVVGVSMSSVSLGANMASAIFQPAGLALGPFAFASWMPARAWLLHSCIPVNYKSSNDFDANTANISLMELEVQPDYIEEYTIGIKP